MNRRQTLLSAAALMAGGTIAPMPTRAQTSAPAQSFSANDLARRTIERRAVEAVIWGMPLVNSPVSSTTQSRGWSRLGMSPLRRFAFAGCAIAERM